MVLNSCLKPLDLDKVSEPRLVIEGIILKDSVAQVRISESVSKTSDNNFPIRTDAIVTLKSSSKEEILSPNSNGLFVSNEIIGKENELYKLTVEIDNSIYTAETYLHKKNIKIRELGFIEDLDFLKNPFYLQIDFFVLPDTLNSGNVSNNGYVRLLQNHREQLGRQFFFDFNSPPADPFLWNLDFVQQNDTIEVELVIMDEGLYDYFSELNEVTNQVNFVGLSVAPPTNVYGNFGTDILGYFGAFHKEKAIFIVE